MEEPRAKLYIFTHQNAHRVKTAFRILIGIYHESRLYKVLSLHFFIYVTCVYLVLGFISSLFIFYKLSHLNF